MSILYDSKSSKRLFALFSSARVRDEYVRIFERFFLLVVRKIRMTERRRVFLLFLRHNYLREYYVQSR